MSSFLITDRFLALWAVLPLAIFGGGGWLFVFESRRGQLRRWDLSETPNDPGSSQIATRLVVAAIAVAVAFTSYDALLEGAGPWLRIENAALWLTGSAAGVVLALYLGLRSAERSLGAGRTAGGRS